MAHRVRSTIDYDEEDTGGSAVVRFFVWAGLAAIAVGSVALAAQTQTGAERLARLGGHRMAVASPIQPKPVAPPALAARPAEDIEQRRLAESIRVLAADRDRLLARLEALERNLDLTGSIPRESAAAAPPPTAPTADAPLPSNWSLVPSTMPQGAGVPAAAVSGANAPAAGAGGAGTRHDARGATGLVADEQAVESVATKTEFAIDIGGDSTFEGLRALWSSLKSRHAALFNGLRPVVAVREGAKPGALELRLVIGPLSNAGTAARLCATLTASGLPCQPTVFDGQRFALR
ncbi:MAG: hypothetical protein ACJ8FM_23960 [Xanthobacteraceae bacterium]